MICRKIHAPGPDQSMPEPLNEPGNIIDDCLGYIQEELIEQPGNSFNHPSSIVAANEACMPFSAGLPMVGYAITCSCQPVPCGDCNCNPNDIRNITNISSIENMGLVYESMIVECAMSLGCYEWCQ